MNITCRFSLEPVRVTSGWVVQYGYLDADTERPIIARWRRWESNCVDGRRYRSRQHAEKTIREFAAAEAARRERA
jgi:hypothetical protein